MPIIHEGFRYTRSGGNTPGWGGNAMQEYILPVSSLAALVMLIVHCWLRRGGRVTAAFFIGGTIFGIARGNIVAFTVGRLSGMADGGKPYLPQNNLLPAVGNSSLQVVIGWM